MPSLPLLFKRDNGLTHQDGSLNGTGAVVIAVCVVAGVTIVAFIVWIVFKRRRSKDEALEKRTYSVHHSKNNSDTGHLLEQRTSWLPDAHKDGLPTFTTSYRPDAPPIFHFPAETFNTSGPSVTSTTRYSQLKHTGTEDEEYDRRESFASTLTPRAPSTVMMLEESAVPFMREAPRASSHSPPRSPKSLPPLAIPGVTNTDTVSTSNYTSAHPVAVMDTPITSAVSSATSESIYSQASATTSRYRHTLPTPPSPPPIPSIPTLIPASPVPTLPARRALPQIPADVLRRVEQTELPGADLDRAPTKVIATLVKKRAHGAELNRNGTAVSRIERSDSITSFDSPQGEDGEVEEFNPSTGRRRMKTTRRKWEAARAKQRSATLASEPASASAELVDVPISTTETSFPSFTAPLRVEKRRDDTTLDS